VADDTDRTITVANAMIEELTSPPDGRRGVRG
jgi:hypothetical protein